MNKSTAFFVVLLMIAGAGCSSADEPYRYWTTNDGVKSKIRLQLIEQTDKDVTLARESDGAKVTLPLARLGAVDRRYLAARKAAETSSTEPAETQKATTDWPQWGGVARNGISRQTGLLKEWPEGLKPAWSISGVGEGFSTPTVSNGVVYVLGAIGDDEKIFALNVSDGGEKWRADLGRKAEGGGYKGPRGSATLNGDFVYAIGSDGELVCAKIADGSVVWRKNLQRDFSGKHGSWFYAESPLIDGDKLICTPGGDASTMVALNKSNGSVVWKGVADSLRGSGYTTAGYSSPIKATIAGVEQYLNFVHGGVISFSAVDGKPLWHYDHPANGTANCSTPVVQGDYVFAASGYGTGGGKAKVSRSGGSWRVSEEYFVPKFQNHHGGFVLVDGYLYGANDTSLMCVDWKTGAVKWQDRSVGKGSVSFADGMLYVRSERGDIALVEASPAGYRERGRFSQPQRSGKMAWPHPVIAADSLFIRDQDRLLCFPLK